MRLRVLTLNVWGLPWPVGTDVGARTRAIAAALPALGCDVAAFQEVWRSDVRGPLVDAARGAGLAHVWHRPDARSGGGLVVASRLPFAGVHFETYALRGFPWRIDHGDYHGGKGFAELALETPDGPVVLYDTHLHARYARPPADPYRGHRTGEVVALAARIRETRRPVVAVGDFNFRDVDPEHGILTGLTGLRDAAAQRGARRATVLAANPYRREREGPLDARIDYVFVRDGGDRSLRVVSVERVLDGAPPGPGARAFSDHAGVLAELEVAPGGAPLPAPDPAARARAEAILRAGQREARARRGDARVLAAAGLGAGALGAAGGRALTRRSLLRVLAGGAALVGLPAGLGAGAFAETAIPAEIAAYDAALARLDALR